jgi:hypothetical protein
MEIPFKTSTREEVVKVERKMLGRREGFIAFKLTKMRMESRSARSERLEIAPRPMTTTLSSSHSQQAI